MSFELYFATTKPEAVAVYDEVVKALEAWRQECAQLYTEWGFDGARAYDFGGPGDFLKACPTDCRDHKGPEIEGFKGGEATYDGEQRRVFSYTLNKRHAGYKERAAQLKAIAEKHTPAEFESDHWVGRSFRRLVCHRLGLFNSVFGGNNIRFSTCWKFNCGTLLVQLPVEKGEDGQHIVTAVPDGWQELTNSQVIALFDGHNRRLDETNSGA